MGHATINLPTKFEVLFFTRYGNMKGIAKCRKLGGLGWLGVTQGQGLLSPLSGGCIPPPLPSLIIVQPGQGGIVPPLSQIGCRLHPIPPCGRPCPRSVKIAPFDTAPTISYSSLIEAIVCTVYGIQPSIGPASLYFNTPLAFNAPDEGVPLKGSL